MARRGVWVRASERQSLVALGERARRSTYILGSVDVLMSKMVELWLLGVPLAVGGCAFAALSAALSG